MDLEHRYGIEIVEGDPIATQPEGIIIPLKPHQLASLHKAVLFERYGTVFYHVENPEEYLNAGLDRRYHAMRIATYRRGYSVHTNIGILGDMVGYGKTLVALSIISSTQTKEMYNTKKIVHSYNGFVSKGKIRVECNIDDVTDDTRTLFETTLVVVPRGPVYAQWINALQNNTRLRFIAINDIGCIRKKCPPQGSSHAQLKAFFEGFDVILIKNTTLQTMVAYYDNNPYERSPIRGYARIMIDEAPDILSKIGFLEYRFVWLISATYMQMVYQTYRGSGLGMIVRELLSEERMYAILVKCKKEFILKSFSIPPYNTIIHRCVAPRYMSIVQPFLTDNVIQLVNANDITGAIRELGGTTETEDNIVALISKNIQRDIFNKEKEKEYIECLDMLPVTRENKLKLVQEELEKLHKKKNDLEERIAAITKDGCSICYSDLSCPVLLSCTHIFCGKCIMKWIEVKQSSDYINKEKLCPTCRSPIDKDKIIAIVKKKTMKEESLVDKKQKQKSELTKLETVIDIITKKQNGRFLVFSQHDSTFREICNELNSRNITSCELKGTTYTMINHLENFKKGTTRVILLNTNYAGSGIDISCATDVILFHNMGDVSKQAIGRAQRVGRTDQLTVHKLYHPNELGLTANGISNQ